MKLIINIFLVLILFLVAAFFLYFNNTSLVDSKTNKVYSDLKDTLKNRGYHAALLVISTKRLQWHNKFQISLSGAATKSRHLTGDAIDFLVFDVNNDGDANADDVDIVYKILDKEFFRNSGGIGTYKKESLFLDRQMIHIDCRKQKGRWHR